MYAHLVLFTLGPGMRTAAEKMADQFAPAYKAAKGFKRLTFLGDDAAGEYGSLSVWESEEDLAAYLEVAVPQFEAALKGIAKGPPTIRTFEVYEPKA